MICEDRARSAAHLAQRRCEVCPESNRFSWDDAVPASLDTVRSDEAEEVLSVLDFRLRKGRDGMRYDGKRAGGDGMLGKP